MSPGSAQLQTGLRRGTKRACCVVIACIAVPEKTSVLRAAIKAVAAGTDWGSPRLADILTGDDAPGRPALSPQGTRALQLYATGMPMKSVARRMASSEETVKQRAGRYAPAKLELYYRAVEDGRLPSPPAPRIPPSRLPG